MSNDSDARNLIQKCLKLGEYSVNLENWFKIHSVQSIEVVDLKGLFDKVKTFLISNNIYSSFKKVSNDYCYDFSNTTTNKQCFSPQNDKDKIDEKAIDYLRNYYEESNHKLKLLLEKYNFKKPSWVIS